MLYKDFFNEHSGKRLTLSTLLAYGFPAMPLAAMLLPVYIYLPAFYAQQLGLGLAAVVASAGDPSSDLDPIRTVDQPAYRPLRWQH